MRKPHKNGKHAKANDGSRNNEKISTQRADAETATESAAAAAAGAYQTEFPCGIGRRTFADASCTAQVCSHVAFVVGDFPFERSVASASRRIVNGRW